MCSAVCQAKVFSEEKKARLSGRAVAFSNAAYEFEKREVPNSIVEANDNLKKFEDMQKALKEWKKSIDFFVFGHRHLPIDYRLNDKSRYINLGDWIRYFTYAVFDGSSLELKSYKSMDEKIVRNNIASR